MIVVGDSYSCGKGGGNLGTTMNAYSVFGYVPQLSKLLGVPDTWVMGIGGTGYVANSGGTASAYSSRLNDVVAAAPDVVIVQGSINDGGMGGLQSAAQTLIANLQSHLPSAEIIMTGPLFAGAYAGNYTSVAQALSAVAAAQSVPFIDATNWATGTGYYGATNGTGTSDNYLNGDAVHPTAAGHLMFANRMAAALEPLLRLEL